jgi:AmmeMemoRadiSam system protein B
MRTPADVRPSPIAGTWYEGEADLLEASVDAYVRDADIPPLAGKVVGLIAPHAGHHYSGGVAGYAYKTVMGLSVDLVAVISPMHQYYPQPLLTSAHQAYHTPLGEVDIDQSALAELDQALKLQLGFGLSPLSRDHEHSLEIQLPFLQRTLAGPFKLLPVMVRDQSPRTARALGDALAAVLAKRSGLLVASTDLSHFYPQREAQQLDGVVLEQMAAFSPEGVYKVEADGKGYACGLGAVTAVLWAAGGLGANKVQVLRHDTSGSTTGDYSSVVGYGAAVILKTE